MRALCAAVTIVVASASSSVSAQSVRLSFADALSRAKTQSPAVLVAIARIEESRARLIGAQIRFRENPSLDVSSGPRFSDAGTTTDFEVGVSQLFETGRQRASRVAGAEAAIAVATADAENERRQVIGLVADAFYRLAHAEAAMRFRVEGEQAAEAVLRIATRRFDAGDIPVLDVNLARTALARARSARMAAEGERRIIVGELQRLVGLSSSAEVIVEASLEEDRSTELPRLLTSLETRPDLASLRASVVEANAEVRLGLANRRPDVSLDARMKQEGGDRAVIAGFTVTLPRFNSGQEQRASGQARAERLRVELDATRAAATTEVHALQEAYVIRRTAAAAFQQEALPMATENERLAQRSYEEGEMSLADLLVVRRELIDTRLEYLDRLLDAALTAVARDSAAGVLQ